MPPPPQYLNFYSTSLDGLGGGGVAGLWPNFVKLSLDGIVLYYIGKHTSSVSSFKGENSCKGSMTEREMLVNVVVDVLPKHW